MQGGHPRGGPRGQSDPLWVQGPRGDARADSDYDLLVLVDREVDMDLERAVVDRLVSLEGHTGRVLTVLIYSRSQWDSAQYRAMPFHKNVTREGVAI